VESVDYVPILFKPTAGREITVSGAAPVLVVDDDAPTRAFVAHVLGRVGMPTRLAASGIEALELAAKQRPAAVLLDISMPGISGYETCHELRDLYGLTLPIVFMSGERTESYDKAAGLLIGADDFLVKPISQDELLARLRVLLARCEYDFESNSRKRWFFSKHCQRFDSYHRLPECRWRESSDGIFECKLRRPSHVHPPDCDPRQRNGVHRSDPPVSRDQLRRRNTEFIG